MSRLEEIKEELPYTIRYHPDVERLISRLEELEYASRYNGELNEFLQKRKLHPRTLGRHVVGVVMDYVEELEEEKYQDPRQGMLEDMHMENERYKQALENIEELWANREFNDNLAWDMLLESRQALKGESQ
ncbi:hypothetical protein [Oceanobacillus alkalisoli]|uniref:hypothetical protein n=1 Tax=Oceanobacillus alkalisoli TaxID=2925113 RepID=UPI001F11F3EA|nr:hypothetical protein [Oceanobacillus alkalisoli]MCF3942190.1 hypothetical protein [Oceanobacillus alkalisoli]